MATLKLPVSEEDSIQGNENATITLVEYGDYQCPHCAAAYYVIKDIQKHFGTQLRFVFRNFPLKEIHTFAMVAAETAEFAGDYDLFWEMHDLIYENQESLGVPLLSGLAETLGLSMTDLELAIKKGVYVPKIQKDFMGGVKSGVNGTPTFFINDQRYKGPFDFKNLIEAIDSVAVG